MNRYLVPGIAIGAVAAVVLATATVWPAQPAPAAAELPDTSRVTVLCPAFASGTATIRVGVADTGEGARTAPLTDPADQREAGPVTVISQPSQPVLVSGLRSVTFGAVSLLEADSGPDRGLAAATCEVAVTQRWFVGVELGEDAQAELQLANTDSTDASVDVTVYGPDGVLNTPGSRGLVVAANSTRSVPLNVLATASGPVSLRVETATGRTAATLRQRLWDGTEPLGAGWVPAAAAPATDLVIPGIAAGKGERQLVVANPGDRTANLTIELLGAGGRSALSGVENLQVPAGATTSIDLGAGLAEQSAGLHLVSAQEVVAAVRQTSATAADQRDPAWAAALQPLDGDGVWPIPASGSATSVLQLSNPGEQDAVVTVGFGEPAGGDLGEQTVPAGSTLEVEVPKAATQVVRVRSGESPVHGAIVVTERLGKVRGLAVVPLVPSANAATGLPPVRFDPHAGS